jgi:hypothetical protein
MKRTTWLLLLALTVAAAVMAAWTVGERNARLAERAYGEPLFADLTAADSNRVAELRLNTGHASWTVKRQDDGNWMIVEKGGYPADIDRVKQALVAVTSASIVAPRTADPKQHHRLDLDTPEQGLASEDDVLTTEVTALDGDGKVLAAVLVGKIKALPTSREPGQAYVRRVGEDQTWLVESRLDIRKDPTAWVDKAIAKILREEVNTVSVTHPDGEILRLVRNKFGSMNVEDLPEELAERDVRLTAAQRAVEFLPFADVKPAAEVDMSGATVMTAYADDGTQITIRSKPSGFEVDGDPGYWVTFEYDHDARMASTEAEMPIPGPNDNGKKREVDVEAGVTRAAFASERTAGWAYLFAEFTAQNFRHRLETVSNTKEDS